MLDHFDLRNILLLLHIVVKLDMELNHNAVVESIASLRGKGLLLTGGEKCADV